MARAQNPVMLFYLSMLDAQRGPATLEELSGAIENVLLR